MNSEGMSISKIRDSGLEQDQAIIERLLELGLERDPFSDEGIDGLFFPEVQRQEYVELLPHLSHYSHYFVVVIGVTGSGKTILKQRFLKQFDPSLTKIALIETEQNQSDLLSPESLLSQMVDGYRIPDRGGGVSNQLRVCDFIHVNGENGIDCLVVADNAELLGEESLALLFEFLKNDKSKNLHVILFASTEIHDLFKSPRIRKSYEEWGHVLDLESFSEKDTEGYINYRLVTAGLTDIQFNSQQIEEVFQQSKGIPSLINRYARQVLLQVLSSSTGKKRFSIPIIHTVAAGCVGLVLLLLLLEQEPVDGNDSSVVLADSGISKTVNYTDGKLEVETESVAVQPEAVKIANTEKGAKSVKVGNSVAKTPQNNEEVMPKPIVSNNRPKELKKKNETSHKKIAKEAVTKKANSKPSVSKSRLANAKSVDQKVQAKENVKPKPRASASLRKKERWLLTLDPASFTLQLLGARDEKSVKAFTEKYKSISGLAYYKTRHKGQGWYVVVQGEYTTRELAQAAIVALPRAIRGRKPWARRVGDVQKSIRRNASS